MFLVVFWHCSEFLENQILQIVCEFRQKLKQISLQLIREFECLLLNDLNRFDLVVTWIKEFFQVRHLLKVFEDETESLYVFLFIEWRGWKQTLDEYVTKYFHFYMQQAWLLAVIRNNARTSEDAIVYYFNIGKHTNQFFLPFLPFYTFC